MQTAAQNNKQKICVVGIDKFIFKNLYQSRWLAAHGWQMHVLLQESPGLTHVPDPSYTVDILSNNLALAAVQVVRYLIAHRHELHHLEVYHDNPLATVAALVGRTLGLKVLAVERGTLYYYLRNWLSWPSRVSMVLMFKLADAVWYKELYMPPIFEELNIRNTILIPNAAPLPPGKPPGWKARDLDFLWVNRLVNWRHPQWFVESILDLRQRADFTVEIWGFLGEAGGKYVAPEETAVRRRLAGVPNVSCHNFADPSRVFQRAKFFICPSDNVFVNYALLEAMSHGVVPIVSDVAGADLIVQDGESGFVVPHSREGLLSGMEQALTLRWQTWQAMSRAARRRVEEDYSLEAWGNKLLALYARLVPPPRL